MKKLIMILLCMLPCSLFAQQGGTNFLLIAAQDSEGWHLACFDVEYQLQRGEDKLTTSEYQQLITALNSLQLKKRLPTLIKYANKYLGKGEAWKCIPDFENLGTLTDFKVGMGGSVDRIKKDMGIGE